MHQRARIAIVGEFRVQADQQVPGSQEERHQLLGVAGAGWSVRWACVTVEQISAEIKAHESVLDSPKLAKGEYLNAQARIRCLRE